MHSEIDCLQNDLVFIDGCIKDHLAHMQTHEASITRLRAAAKEKQEKIELLESAKDHQIQVNY